MSLSSLSLDAFLAVSKELNFTKAAQSLNITQSALSQRVMNLESELATSLFIRDRGGLRLTATAENLLRYCKTRNSLEGEFLSSLKSMDSNELAGALRVGGFSSVLNSVILPTLSPLIKAHPKLQLQFFSREVGDLLSLLKKNEIDYMILDQRIEKEELERVLLGTEVNVLVEANKYSGEDVYLDHDENDEITIRYLKKNKQSSKNIKRHFLDDIYGVIEATRLGLGRSVIPKHLVKGKSDLKVIDAEMTLEIPFYLYFYNQPYYSKTHHSVVAALEDGCKRFL